LHLPSVLLKQILTAQDIETWALLQQHYLPKDYHRIHEVIQRHVDLYKHLPSFDDIMLSLRESSLKEKFSLIQATEHTDIPSSQLLEYIKGEFAEREALEQIEKFLDKSAVMGTAEEIVEELHSIAFGLEDKIELRKPEQDMKRIPLFEPEEAIIRRRGLGLNDEFDEEIKFAPTNFIMVGGYRGAGKSLSCANIDSSVYEKGSSAVYFSIEMTTRETLQRICAISTGVPVRHIMSRNLTMQEWEKVAVWWAHRFQDGEEHYQTYLKHRSFDTLHSDLTKGPLKETQIDIIYEPSLTLSKIRAELDKKMRLIKPEVVVVDYINKVKRGGNLGRGSQFDWTEQVEVSNALKEMAQDYEVLFVSPYQTDATGEARFAKGILDSVDAAFTLNTHSKQDNIITFNCVKMRSNQEQSFTSKINWDTLKIGPETGIIPTEGDGEESSDIE
jgi:hypothetical protein